MGSGQGSDNHPNQDREGNEPAEDQNAALCKAEHLPRNNLDDSNRSAVTPDELVQRLEKSERGTKMKEVSGYDEKASERS